MMKNEIEILSYLDHPSIVKLYETYEYKKKLYLVIEYWSNYIVIWRVETYLLLSTTKTARANQRLDSYFSNWLKL